MNRQIENSLSDTDNNTGVTCPSCGMANPEGRAVCLHCFGSLTAYGGQVTGQVSAATKIKALRLAVRPKMVAVMATFDLLLALFGPFGSVLSRLRARPELNAETTNYLQSAFGAVGVFLSMLIFVPAGLLILYVGWATWTQKRFAWPANLVGVGIVGVMALWGVWPGSLLLRFVVLVMCGALAAFWYARDVRGWYGY